MAAGFQRFLAESLALLARDAPAHYRHFAGQMRGRAVHLSVGTDVLVVDGDGEVVRLRPPTAPPGAPRLRTDERTIVRLVDGERSLEEAILADELELFGGPDELVGFHEALTAYLQAAVRCPAMVPLLRAFRAQLDPRHQPG